MPTTYVDYTATAAQTDFAFSFPYLEDEHVIVQIDGAATTDFTIVTTPSTKIVLDSGATAGQVVRVSRSSQPDQNLVDFVNGSVLTESELDRAYLHNRYLAEESAEQNDVSLRIKQGDTNWDALNKRIKNVGDPVEEQDAATKNYVDGVIGDVAVGTLPDDSVTYAKIQDVSANNVLLGNDNGAGEEIQELTAAEVRTILNVADGATNYSHPNHTGDVTSTGDGATVIADNAVTEAKINNNAVTSSKISDTDTTFKVAANEVAVNDGQADVDFRVEGDTDANLLLCDAGNDRVVIGGTTPTESAKFAVLGDGSAIVASIENADTGSGLSVLVVKGPNPIIQWEDTVGTGNATFNVGVDENVFYFDDVTGTAVRTLSMRKVGSNGVVNLANIPTSSAGLSSGDVWNNSGVLNIVP